MTVKMFGASAAISQLTQPVNEIGFDSYPVSNTFYGTSFVVLPNNGTWVKLWDSYGLIPWASFATSVRVTHESSDATELVTIGAGAGNPLTQGIHLAAGDQLELPIETLAGFYASMINGVNPFCAVNIIAVGYKAQRWLPN